MPFDFKMRKIRVAVSTRVRQPLLVRRTRLIESAGLTETSWWRLFIAASVLALIATTVGFAIDPGRFWPSWLAAVFELLTAIAVAILLVEGPRSIREHRAARRWLGDTAYVVGRARGYGLDLRDWLEAHSHTDFTLESRNIFVKRADDLLNHMVEMESALRVPADAEVHDDVERLLSYMNHSISTLGIRLSVPQAASDLVVQLRDSPLAEVARDQPERRRRFDLAKEALEQGSEALIRTQVGLEILALFRESGIRFAGRHRDIIEFASEEGPYQFQEDD